MKSLHIVASISLFAFSFSVFAQEQPTTKLLKKLSFQDISIQRGHSKELFSTTTTLADFQKLAPQSVLLNNSLNSQAYVDANYFSQNSMFSVMAGFKFNQTQQKRDNFFPSLRLGVTYLPSTSLTGYLNQKQFLAYDTLTSSKTGQTVYQDSINSRYYQMTYFSNQLRFSGALLFSTNPKARWMLYSGIGLSAGFSLNAHTSISYSEYTDFQTRYPDSTTSGYSFYGNYVKNSDKTETFKNKTNLGASLYIPFGIDFRIGKKREFWQNTHFFYEAKLGVNITSIPSIGTFTNLNIQQGLGLRYTWK
jgi:hypothetical protein